MSDRPLDTILGDIDTYQEVADRDLDSLPLRLRPSHEIAAREAKETIVTLRDEYKAKLFGNSLAIVVVGGDEGAPERFASVAAQEAAVVIVDMRELYRELAAKIEPAIGGSREFTVDHLGILNDLIWKLKSQYGFGGDLRFPRLSSVESIATFDDLPPYIEKIMASADLAFINNIFITRKVLEEALARKLTKTCVAVVLNASSDETVGAIFSRVAPVNLNGVAEIDRAFAINVFKEAKSKRVKQTSSNQAQ